MAGRILHHCAHCGAHFNRSRPDANGEKFCSVSCRFWNKVDKSGDDECWEWKSKARSNSGKGYGAFNLDGRAVRSHRMAWELTNGPIPEGLCVCHRCDNNTCCNPSHFFLGSIADNMRDMRDKGRGWNLSKSPELIERLRLAKIGKPRSPETRAKLSAANIGKASPKKGLAMPKIAEAKRAWWAAKKGSDAA